jgi:sugar phosphate permease
MSSTDLTSPDLSHEQRMWRWRILISTYCAYGGYYFCRKVFAICKPDLVKEFGVTMQDVAALWVAYLIAYSVGQFICSYVGRKHGPRFLLLSGLGLSIACNLVFGITNSYWTFMAFMIFNGLFQASGWPGCVGGVAQWLREKERGFIMSIWSTNYVLFSALVKGLGGFLLGAYGWRYAYFGCTLAAFVVWWLVYFWQRNRPQDVGLESIVAENKSESACQTKAGSTISFADYLRVLANPIVLLMGVGYFFLKFLRYALDSWLPTFLQVEGFASDKAAYYSSIFEWAGLAGVIVTGYLFDRYFQRRWATLCLGMSAGMVAGYLCVVQFGANPYALAVCFGLVGFMLMGPDTLLCGALAVQVAGESNAVAVAGIVNGMGSLGPVLQEIVIGKLMSAKDPSLSMLRANYLALGMSIGFMAVMILALLMSRSATRRKAKNA